MKTLARRLARLMLPRVQRSRGQVRLVIPTSWLLVPFIVLAAVIWPGCTSRQPNTPLSGSARVMRVRLLAGQSQVAVAATDPPTYYSASDSTRRILNIRGEVIYPITLSAGGWKIGNTSLGSGDLVLTPPEPRALTVNGKRYRGEYRLVPVGGGKFDVVNHVDIDDYLKGVLRSELFPAWHEQTYRAQAIVARTYALYERASQAAQGRYWDVYADERSQVYGGLEAETEKAIRAVDDTAGVALAYGKPGEEQLFKAYFSSCCGGVTQSAYHAFNEPYIEPLSDQKVGALCNASPKFNWSPVVVAKAELTRRFREYGRKTNRAEKDMALLTRIDVQESNRWGRPVRFKISDANGKLYSMSGEELRWAVNTLSTDDTKLWSSFVSIINDSDAVRFVNGHGHGHGVGMCQWCAEARAKGGLSHEDICLAAYPRARLVHAYR